MSDKLKNLLIFSKQESLFFGSIILACAGFAWGGTIGLSVALGSLMVAAFTMMHVLTEPFRKQAVLPSKPPKPDMPPKARLTQTQTRMVKKLWTKPAKELIVELEGVELTGEHMARLKKDAWLSDENLNFYMNLLPTQTPTGSPIHKLGSHFFQNLSNKGPEYVRRWTKKIKSFEGQVFMPVHVGQNHWCLGVIDFDKKKIRYYDSLGGNGQTFFKHIRLFLQDQKLYRADDLAGLDLNEWTDHCAKRIPRQDNGVDCGVFTLLYARARAFGQGYSFSQQDIADYRRQMTLECHQKKLL